MMGEEAGHINEVHVVEILIYHAKELGPGMSYRDCQVMIKTHDNDMI